MLAQYFITDRFLLSFMLAVPLLFYILTAQSKAVVRSQCLIRVMEWLSTAGALHNQYFSQIKVIEYQLIKLLTGLYIHCCLSAFLLSFLVR